MPGEWKTYPEWMEKLLLGIRGEAERCEISQAEIVRRLTSGEQLEDILPTLLWLPGVMKSRYPPHCLLVAIHFDSWETWPKFRMEDHR